MIYNFRYDRNNTQTVLDRIRKENVLCQGWGGGQQNLDLNRETFAQECFDRYKSEGMNSRRIPTNLQRILQFKNEDLIVVPHLPEDRKVSITVVDGDFPQCYEWKLDENHLNHRIHVKESFGLEGNISIYNVALSGWYSQLQWLRLPVLPISEHQAAFERLISEIKKSPTIVFAESRLDDYLDRTLKDTVDYLVQKLRREVNASNGPISFETVCERLVHEAGYEIIGKHGYDRQGGDFDLRRVRNRGSVSPFESGDTTLYVQAKKYQGTTDEHAVQQLLKIMEKDPNADGCVMSLGDDYSREAVELAKQNDIVLMNGVEVCQLLLKTLVPQQ